MTTSIAAPQPSIGPPTPVRFPDVEATTLENGLRVWTIPRTSTPVVAVLLVVDCGTANDPAGRPGLAGLTADLLDEGAGDRDAIALAEAFSALGSHLEIEVGPDVTTFGLTALSRHFDGVVDLLADVILRPRFDAPDFERVRDLRLNRLRQLSRSPGSAAHRAFLDAVFGWHPYGHGALGTTAALQESRLDDARAFWAEGFTPRGATLIAVGDVTPDAAVTGAARALGGWAGVAAAAVPPADVAAVDRRVLLVDRPGASQSELRVGHVGPARRTPAYHAIVTMNAVLGGQFASRVNRVLREQRGVTYGARTWFEFRRICGGFACETSVQSDATAESVAEVLRQFQSMLEAPVEAGELGRARASLIRGYVRNFETPVQLARAAAQLAVHGMPPSVYDDFVPAVGGVTAGDVRAAAREFIRPDDAAIVVVGDAARCRPSLELLGREVAIAMPEF